MPKSITSGLYRTFRNLNPNETFIEYEGSTITIPIRARMLDGHWEEEKLKLAAFMRLEVFPPYLNGLGVREFKFIIRDWELFGYSPLLNRLFMGDERGYLEPGLDPREGREQAVMTFTVAHHYIKYDDDENLNLGPAHKLSISDITHHSTLDGDIFWQIEKDPEARGYMIRFHIKPPSNGEIAC